MTPEMRDVRFILDVVTQAGDALLCNFKKTPIPSDLGEFMSEFRVIEQTCLGILKPQLDTKFPNIV